MTARKSLALATATVALGTGLAVAAPAAQAAPVAPVAQSTATSQTGAAAAKASWHLIWGPKSHKPTKYWATPDFVPRSSTLGVNARCWNGGDGTKYKIDVVRTRDKKVVKKGGWGYCTGNWMTVKTKASSGTAYYMRICLKGKAHTVEAKAYYYR
ncbi:hypothetical protein PV682_17255 [Streptomyces niveiscabiei]|uniref:hypothetical protein n=1 Tax=Streptomyces niveiscabiei TaxID=164115 RepID=UPI0029AE5692|nr:hypothetical protein [Streptomyces niveiscabiei]MDX3383203.1 hypothetical protein [Streptomyces niveiscabiei]